jgi:thymidine kinase
MRATADSPTLIIIDEATLFDIYELDHINKLAKAKGITVLAAGDMD